MSRITMDSELLAELVEKRGFKLTESGTLTYMSGSISNYVELKVHQPRMHCSLEKDEENVLACYIEYERFQEPGYLEVDSHDIHRGYVAVEHLREYLDKKGIKMRHR